MPVRNKGLLPLRMESQGGKDAYGEAPGQEDGGLTMEKEILSMTAEQAIEMLKNPQKYMFIHNGEIELEGWLKEAISMGIEALKGRTKNGK